MLACFGFILSIVGFGSWLSQAGSLCLFVRAGTCDLEHWLLGGIGPGRHFLVEQTAGCSAQ